MNSNQDQRSHLFLVRYWSEEVGNQKELRGRVQHVLSGEARTFCDWPTLVDLLQEMADREDTEMTLEGGVEARGHTSSEF